MQLIWEVTIKYEYDTLDLHFGAGQLSLIFEFGIRLQIVLVQD